MAKTKSSMFPEPEDVREAVVYYNKIGKLHVPSVNKVEQGYQYGANKIEYTGTLKSESNVKLPPPDKVEEGYQYGLNGTEFTGTLKLTSNTPAVNTVVDSNVVKVCGENVVSSTEIDCNVVMVNGNIITEEIWNKFLQSIGA